MESEDHTQYKEEENDTFTHYLLQPLRKIYKTKVGRTHELMYRNYSFNPSHTKGPFSLFFQLERKKDPKRRGSLGMIKRYLQWKQIPDDKKKSLSDLYASQFFVNNNLIFHPSYTSEELTEGGVALRPYIYWVEKRIKEDPSLLDAGSSLDLAFRLGNEWNHMRNEDKRVVFEEYASKFKRRLRITRKDNEGIPLSYYAYLKRGE